VNHNTQKYLVFSTFYKSNLDSHKHNWLDKYLSFLASRTVIEFSFVWLRRFQCRSSYDKAEFFIHCTWPMQ